MDDPFELVSAMFVMALSAVLLVGGQQYLVKQIEPNVATSAARPVLAENAASEKSSAEAASLKFRR